MPDTKPQPKKASAAAASFPAVSFSLNSAALIKTTNTGAVYKSTAAVESEVSIIVLK